jgi:class 3 adenylate cyclase
VSAHGVVTIMHTDVEGSTELTTRLGDAAARSVLEHTKGLVREQVEAGGGREIDAVGDASMSTFTSTRDAIACAMAIQRVIDEQERADPDSTLRVRVGLNVGEVLERDGHPFGAAVNAGARVMSKADGGEILVSEMVRQLAGTIPGVEYRDRGRHSFKGWDERWRLYEVVWWSPAQPPEPRRARPRRRVGRRALLAVVLLVALGVAVAVAAILLGGSGGPAGLPRIDRQSAGLIEPASGKIVAEVAVGPEPRAIAVGGGSVWVANEGNETVTRIVSSSRKTTTITLQGHPTGLTFAAGAVWAATIEGGLIRIDPKFNSSADPVNVSGRVAGPPSVVSAGGSLWVSAPNTTLVRIGIVSGSQKSFIPDTGVDGPLASGDGALWAAAEGFVAPINPVTGLASGAAVRLNGVSSALTYGGGALWTVSAAPDDLQRVDPGSGSVTNTIAVGRNPTGVAVGSGFVWVTNGSDGTLTRVDLGGSAKKTIRVGGSPAAVAAAPDGIWVTSG